MTVMAKLFLVAVDIAVMSFCVSNTWSIEETVKPVRPLKITALICALYCGIYSVVVTIGDVQSVSDGRWYGLSGLAGFAFIVMVIAAAIVSKNGKKKIEKEAAAKIGDVKNAEVQATIQEMVEKEVQERLKEERAKAERDAMPPLQSDDLPPTVSRGNETKISVGQDQIDKTPS